MSKTEPTRAYSPLGRYGRKFGDSMTEIVRGTVTGGPKVFKFCPDGRNSGYTIRGLGIDVFETVEEAVSACESRRELMIHQLEREIAELRSLKFEVSNA